MEVSEILKTGKLIVGILSISLMLSGCSTSKNISSYEATQIASITIGNEHKSVYKEYTEQLVLTVDYKGKIQSKSKSLVSETESSMLELPDLDKLDGYDIMSNKAYFNSTWQATLDESAQQVKWFIRRGYDILMQANTQRYIEMYLGKEEDIKRVIITKDTLSVTDVASAYSGTADEYISLNRLDS